MRRRHKNWTVIVVLTAMALAYVRSSVFTRPAGSAERATSDPPAFAGDWPQWRGPNGDGISRETDWSTDWPAAGPPKLWEAAVGIGFSSASVSDGRLYTMGYQDGRDTVWCLDAKTGQVLWKHSYECAIVDNLHEGGPAATPTVADDAVFTVSKEGHFFCLDRLTGEVRWKQEFQPLLGVEMPAWGFSCSPLVWGRLVIVEAGRTAAFDRATGELIWQTEKYRPGYGSPAVFQPADEPMIAVLNNDDLLLVGPADGQEVAKFPWVTSFATNATTPVIWRDTIFLSTAYGRGCVLVKFSQEKLEALWENKNMKNHMANSVLYAGHFYGFDGNSNLGRVVQLACLDYETGKEVWAERGFGCGSLLVADGRLIILSDKGELVVAPATAEGLKPIARAEVIDGRCWTVPVLARGVIYCRNAAGRLVALDVHSR